MIAFARTSLIGVASAMLATSAVAEPLTMSRPVDFADSAIVRDAVRNECRLQEKVPDYIAQYARKNGTQVVFSVEEAAAAEGRVLLLEITDVSEFGNAMSGRQKSMTISGELLENGQMIGSFRARRATMGGFMGGYMGNCSFFHRCARALGKDVSRWLRAPAMDSVLGG